MDLSPLPLTLRQLQYVVAVASTIRTLGYAVPSGTGLATPVRTDGTWRVRRDIALGAGIADYARCSRR